MFFRMVSLHKKGGVLILSSALLLGIIRYYNTAFIFIMRESYTVKPALAEMSVYDGHLPITDTFESP